MDKSTCLPGLSVRTQVRAGYCGCKSIRVNDTTTVQICAKNDYDDKEILPAGADVRDQWVSANCPSENAFN